MCVYTVTWNMYTQQACSEPWVKSPVDNKPGTVVHTSNPDTQKATGSEVQDLSQLCTEFEDNPSYMKPCLRSILGQDW